MTPPVFRCPNPTCGRPVDLSGSQPVLLECPACRTPLGDDARATAALPAAAGGEDARETAPLDGPTRTREPVPQELTPPLPAAVGRFAVRARLGEGAFGDVYRAHDPQLDREVALKVAKPGTLTTPERVGRFLREARAAANLRHPHIVPVFDSGRDGDRHYIATGFIDGRTLEAEIEDADGRPTDLRRAAAVVRKLAEALGYAHKQGVVHRDVKPANVLVDASGEPSLTDFGLAVRAGDEAVKTQDGKVMGTPAYMSPEQAAGRSAEATAASDQYALGVILYEMATGRRPFEGPVELVIFQQIQVEPPRPRSQNRAIPKDLETVILKCLEKEPGKRYASCEALAEDLRHFLDGEPVKARRIGPVERFGRWCRRNPAVAASVSFGVLALLIGTVVSLAQAGEARTQAKLASNSAADALAKKKLADDNADEKAKEAKRANDEKERADGETVKARAAAEENLRRLDLARLVNAQAAFAGNLVQSARDILDEVAPRNRCAVWGLLHRRFGGGLFTLDGHTDRVRVVAFSADGSRIVTGSDDGTARVWDARTGQTMAVLRGHTGRVLSVAVSADGSRVVTGSTDMTARVWDARTGRVVASLPESSSRGTGEGVSVAVSADGTRVVTGSSNRVYVWDARTARVVSTISRQADWLSLSGDGSRVAFGTSMTTNVWGVGATGLATQVLESSSVSYNGTGAISPDGSRVVTGSNFSTTEVLDVNTGQSVVKLQGHRGAVVSVAFTADGSRIVTGSDDNTARVWDVSTGSQVAVLLGHTGAVRSVGASGDGARAVTASADGVAGVWDANTGQSYSELRGHTRDVRTVAVSAEGGRILTGSRDGTVRIRDARTGRTIRDLKIYTPQESNASFRVEPRGFQETADLSADGSRVVTGTDDGMVRVWDSLTGRVVAELSGPPARYGSETFVTFVGGGPQVLIVSGSHPPRIWDTDSPQVVRELRPFGVPPTDPVAVLAVSAGGPWVVTGSRDRIPQVWDVSSNRPVAELKMPSRFGGEWVISADGSRVAAFGTSPPQMRVWDGRTGAVVANADLRLKSRPLTEPGKSNKVTSMAISADGSRVVAGSEDMTAYLWDAGTPDALIELRGHTGGVTGVAFSPDGSRVVTRTIKDGTVRFWDAKTGQELATLDVPPGYESQPVALTNSSLLVACSNVVRVWDVRPRAAPVELKGHDAHVDILAISGDGSQVITGSQDPIARVWDAGTGRPIALLRGHKGEVHSVGLSADGFRAVTGSSDRTARVWDARTGQTISELKGHTDTVTSVALSADGARVVTGSSDGTARVWDAHTGQTLAVLKGHPKGVRSVAIAGDASRVVTCSYGSTVVWDALTGTPTPNKLEGHDGWGRLAALSADGNRVMIWDLAGLAREWDTTTGRRLPEEPVPSPCPGGDYRQHEGAFVRTPDGRFTFASVGGRVRRVPTDVDALERAERLWLTRPDPDWNARRATDLVKENNDFGAAFQWAAERRAQGVLAFEAGDLDQAHSYFLHAALLTGVPPQRFIGGDGTGSTGLLAELFDGVGFDRRVRERRDDLLRWPLPGRGVTADPSLGPEQFSIRWTGWLRAPVPGLYGLEFAADDGVRVWIDGKQVIDAWKSPQVATHKRNIELTGIPQEIKIEYFQDRGGAGYDFRWVPPGATEAVRIPPSVLSPPRRPTAAPPPREVIRRIPFAVP